MSKSDESRSAAQTVARFSQKKTARINKTELDLGVQDKDSPADAVSRARFDAVMDAAKQSGLLTEKTSRIAGRISPDLIRQAKKQTGIKADTDLIAFALANVALEDDFAEVFKQSRGAIDPALKLGF